MTKSEIDNFMQYQLILINKEIDNGVIKGTLPDGCKDGRIDWEFKDGEINFNISILINYKDNMTRESIEFRYDQEFNMVFAIFLGRTKTVLEDLKGTDQIPEEGVEYTDELIYCYTNEGGYKYILKNKVFDTSVSCEESRYKDLKAELFNRGWDLLDPVIINELEN